MTAYQELLHPRGREGRWIKKLGLPAMKVGGAVRDPLLGKEPADTDYMIMASPEAIKKAVKATGHRAEDLTVRDRLVGVRAFGPDLPIEGVELTPPRVEVSTGDGRHDFTIVPHPAVAEAEPGRTRTVAQAKAIRDAGFYSLRQAARDGLTEDLNGEGLPDNERSAALDDPDALAEDSPFTVYRVRPRVDTMELRPGMFVTDVRSYAERHARAWLGGAEVEVDEFRVRPSELETDGVTPHDFLYVPPEHPAYDLGDPLRDDALRRDFTVNALYEDTETGDVIDPTGRGIKDASSRTLSVIGDDSFIEDPLRILRGLRFMSQHGLTPDARTLDLMKQHAPQVTALTRKGVSGTAVKELSKMMMGENVGDALRTMRDTGVMRHFLPELEPIIGFDQESRYHDLPLDEHIIRVVEGVTKQGGGLAVRLAALFHDSGKPATAHRGEDGRLHYYAVKELGIRDHAVEGADIARKTLRRLNFPADVIEDATTIVREHMVSEANSKRPVRARQLLARVPNRLIGDILRHRRADFRAKGEGDDADVSSIDRFEAMVERELNAPVKRSDLKVSGGDVIAAGIKPGPEVGQVLTKLLDKVIADPAMNTRERLTREVAREVRRRKSKLTEAREPSKRLRFVVSVDGLSGSGRTPTAARVAEALNARYVESSALFRVAALAKVYGMDPVTALGQTKVTGHGPILVGGDDVSLILRVEPVNAALSEVARDPAVREAVRGAVMRASSRPGITVVDGELAEADVRFYLPVEGDELTLAEGAEVVSEEDPVPVVVAKVKERLRDHVR